MLIVSDLIQARERSKWARKMNSHLKSFGKEKVKILNLLAHFWFLFTLNWVFSTRKVVQRHIGETFYSLYLKCYLKVSRHSCSKFRSNLFPASVPSEVFLHIDFKLFSRDFLPFRSPSMKLTLTSPHLILLPLICVHGFIMEGNKI